MSVVKEPKNDMQEFDKSGIKAVAWILGIPAAAIALFVIWLIVAFVWSSVAGPSDEYKAEQFGTACYEKAKEQFKNPESAQLTDTGITVVDETEDSTNYKLSGTGSGMNGFGGYSTVTWECEGNFNNVTEQAYVNAYVTND